MVVGLAQRRGDRIVMKRVLLVCVSLLTLTACTGAHTSPTPAQSTTAPSTTAATSTVTTHESPIALGRPGCQPPSPISRGAGFPEVEGSGNQVQLWGLIMADGPDNPLRVDEQVKIVWRIAGCGELH